MVFASIAGIIAGKTGDLVLKNQVCEKRATEHYHPLFTP
jgi:hypothetical protein